MIPSSILFGENSTVEYEGKKYCKFFSPLSEPGEYELIIKFVSTNSNYVQTINVTFSEFKGKVFLDEAEIKVKKRGFYGFSFCEDTAPAEIRLRVIYEQGYVTIVNGMRDFYASPSGNVLQIPPIMIIEEKSLGHYRFFCNDYENDDDFDDLIFDMKVRQIK